ncbi:hypothetical protein CAEBREN_01672 [Caenorhabditis brenneri]|uniref:Uncharacterized protein n=1 Tax=Caenorhabditis brenneri TaxID=135651 RepID=G0P294_CAEBE|nr:hypothetical protein CAEBREN_01672 [Caenorhabditis brenneri]
MAENEKELTENQEKAFAVIAGRYGLDCQLKLRKLSKRIRAHIDSQPVDYKTIHITISSRSIYVKYDETRVQYTNDPTNGISYENYSRKCRRNQMKVIRDREYQQTALNDLNIVFSNRNNQFESLFIEYHQRVKTDGMARRQMMENGLVFLDDFIIMFSDYGFYHHVKKLSVQTDDLVTFHSILDCLKPGVLEEMELVNIDFPKYQKSEDVTEEYSKINEYMVEYERKRAKFWEFLDGEMEVSDVITVDQDRIARSRQFEETQRVYWLHNQMIRIPIAAFFHLNVFEIYHEQLDTLDIVMMTGNHQDEPDNKFKRALFYHPSKLNLVDLDKFFDLKPANKNLIDDFVSQKPDLKGRYYYHLGESEIYDDGSVFIAKLAHPRWVCSPEPKK